MAGANALEFERSSTKATLVFTQQRLPSVEAFITFVLSNQKCKEMKRNLFECSDCGKEIATFNSKDIVLPVRTEEHHNETILISELYCPHCDELQYTLPNNRRINERLKALENPVDDN